LLDLPVPFRLLDGLIHVEAQAERGLFRWLENFKTVSVCAPVVPQAHLRPEMDWVPTSALMQTGRLAIHLLPWGFHPREHLKEVRGVRALLRRLVAQHQYLHFSNLGWFGAWGRIGAEEAYRLGKPYAVWLDWVIHEMPIKRENRWVKALWRRLEFEIVKRGSLRTIKRARLGLLHGLSVYESYAPYVSVAKVVHDVHLDEEDILDEPSLEARLNSDTGCVSILYVGRVHGMKGPRQWLDTIDRVIRTAGPGSPRVQAKWLGEGPMLDELRAVVSERGLSARISFPGNEPIRSKVLATFRAADLFVFCHLTPESPRCLIEALMSGLPILGFESAYANDLTFEYGGGATVPVGDVDALAELVKTYINDRNARNELSRAALSSGKRFSERSVFRHRSDLIKEYL
jgi:glycosyltransferase involved in cell wall biosynthesis